MNPKYYQSDIGKTLETIDKNGVSFIVAGRVVDGVYCQPNYGMIPDGYRSMFNMLTEQEFRIDLSSTELRAK